MQLHDLRPAPGAKRRQKRVGRGSGSGHGDYSTRGMKGQKARSGGGVPPHFEGGQLPMVKRMPRKRGFVNIFREEYQIVNVADLNEFEAGSEVTAESLTAARLIKKPHGLIKILGNGELDRSLKVWAHKFSAGAREKITAAGGEPLELPREAQR
ncbi:MAG: 50S ribosomal protein L15 [Chloroflexi bacterium]|nr:50S ribosomal protein L15 [Chloroflexota bacterium]